MTELVFKKTKLHVLIIFLLPQNRSQKFTDPAKCKLGNYNYILLSSILTYEIKFGFQEELMYLLTQ